MSVNRDKLNNVPTDRHSGRHDNSQLHIQILID